MSNSNEADAALAGFWIANALIVWFKWSFWAAVASLFIGPFVWLFL